MAQFVPGNDVASNKSLAFAAARPKDGFGDPFNLKENLKSFKMGLQSSKNGPGKFVQLDIVITSSDIEKEIFDNVARGGQSYEFRFGWGNGVGKSQLIIAELITAEYNLAIGQEVSMHLEFASASNSEKEIDELIFDKDSKAILSDKISLKSTPVAEAVEKLVTQALSLGKIHCSFENTAMKPQIAWSISCLKKSIMEGWKADPGGGSDKLGNFTGKGEYSDTDIGDMDEDYAQDLAIKTFFQESPFTLKMANAETVSNPEDPEGQLLSKYGEGRDGDVRENTQAESGALSLTVQGKDHLSTLLGGPSQALDVPAVIQGGFSPLIEGPSEHLQKLSESLLIFNETATLPKWDDSYFGRYEFWVQGQQQVIQEEGARDLSVWSRDDGYGWVPLAPTISYALNNLTLMGETSDSEWSDSMFEVPPVDIAFEEQYGNGTWFFRLTKQSVAKVIAETSKMQALAEQVNDLNTREFYPTSRTSLTSEDYSFDSPEFLYNDNPFNDDSYATPADGGPFGRTPPPALPEETPADDPILMLNIKGGDSYTGWVNRFTTWINEVIADNGHPVAWSFMPAEDLQKQGKAMDAPEDALVLFMSESRNLPPNPDVTANKLEPIKTFPWISQDGTNIELTVGGWESIVQSVSVKTETIQAIPFQHTDVNKLRNIDEAEGLPPEPALPLDPEIINAESNDPDVVLYAKFATPDLYNDYVDKVAGEFVFEDFQQYTEDYFAAYGTDSLTPVQNFIRKNAANFKSNTPILQQSTGKNESPDSIVSKGGQAMVNWSTTYFSPKITTLGIPELCTMYEISRDLNLIIPATRGVGESPVTGMYKISSYEHTISPDAGFTTQMDLIPISPKEPEEATTPTTEEEGASEENTASDADAPTPPATTEGEG